MNYCRIMPSEKYQVFEGISDVSKIILPVVYIQVKVHSVRVLKHPQITAEIE